MNANDPIESILEMFDVHTFYTDEPFEKLVIKNTNINMSEVEIIMKQNRFIFL